MAKFVLLHTKSKRVVHEFDASDLPAARVLAATWALANMTKVVLCAALRIITPTSTPPPPSADDQAYP